MYAKAGGRWRGLEVCRAGMPDRNRMAKGGDRTLWCLVESTESYIWTECWVKPGKGNWHLKLQCLVEESGLNSESSEESLQGSEKERERSTGLDLKTYSCG